MLPEICVACNNLQIRRFSGVGYMTATADVRDGSEAEETGPVRLSTDSDRVVNLTKRTMRPLSRTIASATAVRLQGAVHRRRLAAHMNRALAMARL